MSQLREHTKHQVDVEATTAAAPPQEEQESAGKQHLRSLGQSQLDAVLSKAKAGQDPWEYHQLPKQLHNAADDTPDADVAAMGAWLERNRPLLLAGGFVLAQGGSWVLMKGSLQAMHTPAVLTFLHLLTAVVMQLVLVSNHILPAPHLSAAAAKGALMPAVISSLQLLLVMGVLEHASVFLLLCWMLVINLIVGMTRATNISQHNWLAPTPAQLPWLAVAAAGLGVEVLLDRGARSVTAYLMLLAWTVVVVVDLVWQQVKADASLGHRIMEADFLFRARELSDLEESLSPSSRALLTASLPALPVLVLGLISLEAKDLVEHEPSVPTLEALLLSCLLFAAAHNLQTLLTTCATLQRNHCLLLQAAAAVVAVALELWERSAIITSKWCLLGVILSIVGVCCSHLQSAHKCGARSGCN